MLSTTAEYALRIMISLTEAKGNVLTSADISARTHVSQDYTIKILQTLRRTGFVLGQRGRRGGFQLTCDPSVTTLLDVVNVIDPLERIVVCPLDKENHQTNLCALHKAIDEALGGLEDGLKRMTLTSIVEDAVDEPLCRTEPAEVELTIGMEASAPSPTVGT